MNRLITSIIVIFVAITTFAQNNAEIAAYYDFTCPKRTGKMETTKMTLLASATGAKFFNDVSLWIDSLKSTPEGDEQYFEILKKTSMIVEPDGSVRIDMSKAPQKSSYTYVFTNLAEKSLIHYDKFGSVMGYYTEPLSEIEWTVSEDSVARILGYECKMATSNYHGRDWKVWFTTDIPMPFGPWKLRGLPGFILKAEANGGYCFTLTGLEKTNRTMTPMYLQERYSEVDRKKALADGEDYINNMMTVFSFQARKNKSKKGNPMGTTKFDGLIHCLEPDYKMK